MNNNDNNFNRRKMIWQINNQYFVTLSSAFDNCYKTDISWLWEADTTVVLCIPLEQLKSHVCNNQPVANIRTHLEHRGIPQLCKLFCNVLDR